MTKRWTTWRIAVLVACLGLLGVDATAETIVPSEALVIGRTGRGGRAALHTDAIESQLVNGTWETPIIGSEVTRPNGQATSWELAVANDNGWIQHGALRGSGYALFKIDVPGDCTMMLHARGHSMVYVNGRPRAGDPYDYNVLRLPVRLHAGENEFLFRVGRGRVRMSLHDVERPVMILPTDGLLPDIIRGEGWGLPGAVVVANATEDAVRGLRIRTSGGGLPIREERIPAIPPMSVRKVGFSAGGHVPPTDDRVEVTLELIDGNGGEVVDETTRTLRVRGADQNYRRTFVSDVDGSVQYYGVRPMVGNTSGEQPALFLSLHGAGVEAGHQAACYRSKDWGHVVAPTNRRKFGFDWEDWGRLDALEVLAHASGMFDPDPSRIYLTGHSMGGHGTWHLGVTFPDRFAAIGPSAGWRSFWSYGGAISIEDPNAAEAILVRSTTPSRTTELSRNFLHWGIYILHGDADSTVPVDQARYMRAHLEPFHDDIGYHEQEGAGHWWGNQCMDWPAMFEFFRDRRRAADADVDHVEFMTANPGVSATSRWVTIEAQQRALAPSRVVADRDVTSGFQIMTTNVSRLSLDLSGMSDLDTMAVMIDGQSLAIAEIPDRVRRVWLTRGDDRVWTSDFVAPDATLKGPHRSGPFKDAFQHRMIFVYATQGTEAENDWASAKARYDAETFYYRGNGSVDVVADIEFDASEANRGVILYGNADTNAAWPTLLATSPVQVTRSGVQVGDREIVGEDLACLFLRPRPDSDVACVAVISGTGVSGCRLTERLPYFVSGVAYPDWIVLDTSVLMEGSDGVRAAGFFGTDWSVEAGESAWTDDDDVDGTS